jgi:uncharacterized protein YecE (DUF72 family)
LLYIGTSGWAYPEWRGALYPARLPQSQFLEHYAMQLSACEVNATFYRVQPEAAIDRWSAAVPAGFRFAVKANRRLTYRKRLAPDPATVAFAAEFLGSLVPLGQKLGCLLLQVPEFIERDDEALAELIGLLPDRLSFACELQNRSWESPEVEAMLAGRGGTASVREERGEVPDRLPAGPFAYVRLKGLHYSDEARDALRSLLEREACERDIYVFARHKDVPPDDPHTGPGLAQWLSSESYRARGRL